METPIAVTQQVGLALRAHRRKVGRSQREYAAERGIGRAQLAKMEMDASGVTLGAVMRVLEGTGYRLAVVPVDAVPSIDWDHTDLEARTRKGRRFPANRLVRRSPHGPEWWWYHEVLGSGDCGDQPTWSAEGFQQAAFVEGLRQMVSAGGCEDAEGEGDADPPVDAGPPAGPPADPPADRGDACAPTSSTSRGVLPVGRRGEDVVRGT